MQTGSVKKSVSLPQDLWDFIDQRKKTSGHGMASRVIHEALRDLRKNMARRKSAK
jgi:Arc/MetJ-type ribon-helix-helix transcriptional regulator